MRKTLAVLTVIIVVLAAGCTGREINTAKKPVEFKAVTSQGKLNESIAGVHPVLLEIHMNYLLTWNNTSVEESMRVPLVFVRMKNNSWLIGADELSDSVFLLHPGTGGYGKLYSCHCPDGRIIDFRVLANPESFHTVWTFNVDYEVKRQGMDEYTFITTGISSKRVEIFGKTYEMELGEFRGTWATSDLTMKALGNHTYVVRVLGRENSGVQVTLSVIPIVLRGGKENVTLTTIPLDVLSGG